MTLHEGWHKAHPNYPCEYDTCPRGQVLDLEHATYTAAEVKVLTEAALRLGRQEALDEAAAKADWLAEGVANPEKPYNEAFIHACGVVARHIRALASQPLQDSSSARTDLSVDTDLPQDPQAVRSPQERCGLADLDNRCIQFGEEDGHGASDH